MANEASLSLESLLGEVMRDPAKMAQMQSLAASLGLGGPSPATEEKVEAPSEPASPSPAMPTNLSALLPMLSGGGPQQNDRRTALLMALRPYLNDGRREMIDTIVALSRLGGGG